jgi:hypothetical protein
VPFLFSHTRKEAGLKPKRKLSDRMLVCRFRSCQKLVSLEIMSWAWLRFAIVVVSAALCLGTSVAQNPIKEKGAGPLFRVHRGHKWGFMDRTGKIVIEPQFSDASDFFDGLAKIVTAHKSCFIDEKGKVVIPCNFDGAGDFREGLAPVRIGRLWGYIDRSGRTVIAPKFQAASEFRDGLGRVEVWDQIRCGGQMYTKDDAPVYAFVIHDILFTVETGCSAAHPRFGYVNKNGAFEIKPNYSWADDFSENLATVAEPGQSKRAYIDKTGRVVIPSQFDQAFSFSEGLAAVEIGFREEGRTVVAGKFGFIDKTGKFVIAPKFSMAFGFSEGLAMASEDTLWGYIDHTGRFVIAPAYSHALGFSEGLAEVFEYEDGGWFHMDRTGKRLLNPKSAGFGFSDGLTIAVDKDKLVYVDKTGGVIAPYEADPAH